MKIKSLALENITSFRGKHKINFAELASQSDLFAITGPTGAGKSTLLNAMAMAMFSDNVKGLSAPDLVTTGEPSGSITLCLEIFGDHYRVEWTCLVLKKDGTPRAKPTSNSRVYKNEELFEDKIENVLNLDFKQFNQVIVLNQGKFSEFLTSTFSERKNILEGLLGHSELKDLSKRLRAKKSEMESEIKSLKEQSEQAQIISDEDLTVLKKQLKSALERKMKEQQKATIVKRLAAELKEIVALTQKEIKNDSHIQLQQARAKAIELELDKLTSEHKNQTKKLNTQKENFKNQKPFLEKARTNLQAIESAHQKTKTIEKNLEDLHDQLSKNQTYAHESANKKKAIQARLGENDRELSLLKKPDLKRCSVARDHLFEMRDFKTKQTMHLESLEYYQAEKTKIEIQGESFKKEKDQLYSRCKDYLKSSSAETVAPENFDELALNAEAITAEVKNATKLYKKLESELLVTTSELTSLEGQLQGINIKLVDHKKKQSEQEDTLKKALADEQVVAQEIELLQESLTQFELLNSAKEIIERSQDPAPCPVCETTFEKKQWIEKFERSIKTQAQDTSDQLEKLKSKHKSLTQKIHTTQGTTDLNQKQLEQYVKEQSNLSEAFVGIKSKKDLLLKQLKTLSNSSDEKSDSFLNALNDVLKLTEGIKTERQKWIKSEAQIKAANTKIDETKTSIESQMKALSELALFPKGKLETKTGQDLLISLESAIKTLHEQDKAQEQLKLIEQNQERAKEQKTEIIDKKTIQTEALHAQNTELSALENEKSRNSYPDNPTEVSEKREQEIEDISKDLEKSRRVKNEKQIDFDKNLSQINLLKEQNIEIRNLSINYFDKFQTQMEEAKALKLVPEDDTELLKLIKHATSEMRPSIFKENIDLWAELLEDSVLPLTEKIERGMAQSIEEISRYSTQIEQNDKQNQKIKGLLLLREQLLTSLESLLKLEHYVGKDQFRDFTLAVLEENLLKMANQEISSLADGRYKLIHAKAGKRSEFLVQDYWQGGLKRKVSTLSGGETFLLSLGLSLGLCEISRGQTEIDCFFIDEGFGTLDNECIEQVLNCLMAIQSRGKQIGLISHVKNLTDQIPVKIELSKNNFGESSLTLQ